MNAHTYLQVAVAGISTFVVFFSFSFVHAQSTCLKYPSNSIPPAGYGASWDVFSAGKELLVKSNCPTSGTSLDITVGKGDAAQYIWGNSYYYNPSVTPPWTVMSLEGTKDANGWVTSGAGTKTITTPFTSTTANPFYFVGYVCTYNSSIWKCGCANASCTSKHWQLQGYTGNGGGTTGIAPGRGIRGATSKILLVPQNYCCTGPIASLAGTASVMTKYIYVPPSENAVEIGSQLVFSHSTAGIEAGAQKAVNFIFTKSDGWQNKVAIMDFETLQSVNVPSEFLPYDPTKQDDWVVWYRPNLPSNLRMAAVRFNSLMYSSMHQKLEALGHTEVEFGGWGWPAKMLWGDTYPKMQSRTNLAISETLDTVIRPNLSFGVPYMYFDFTPSMAAAMQAGTLTRDDVIDWMVNIAKVARASYPPEYKILPWLWPRCFGTCPFDTVTVPPGWMRELAERLLDEAHVDGFTVWRSSKDDDFGSSGSALFSARWQEVVDVIHERGGFRTVAW